MVRGVVVFCVILGGLLWLGAESYSKQFPFMTGWQRVAFVMTQGIIPNYEEEPEGDSVHGLCMLRDWLFEIGLDDEPSVAREAGWMAVYFYEYVMMTEIRARKGVQGGGAAGPYVLNVDKELEFKERLHEAFAYLDRCPRLCSEAQEVFYDTLAAEAQLSYVMMNETVKDAEPAYESYKRREWLSRYDPYIHSDFSVSGGMSPTGQASRAEFLFMHGMVAGVDALERSRGSGRLLDACRQGVEALGRIDMKALEAESPTKAERIRSLKSLAGQMLAKYGG